MSANFALQFRLLHLAHGIAGQGVDLIDALGKFELGELVRKGGNDRLLVGGLIGCRCGDDGDDAFAEIRMRHTDDGGFADAVNQVQLGLDFLGIDVEPAGDDQILAASDDGDPSGLVLGREISR